MEHKTGANMHKVRPGSIKRSRPPRNRLFRCLPATESAATQDPQPDPLAARLCLIKGSYLEGPPRGTPVGMSAGTPVGLIPRARVGLAGRGRV
jgi:hypothetical protein